MRQTVGVVLVGVGAFFLTLAPLLRTYIFNHVAVAPSNYFIIQHNQDTNGSYFDVQRLKVRHGVTIRSTATIRGNVSASHGKIDVWDEFVSTGTTDGVRIDYTEQRTAFNGLTAYAVNCCGAYLGSDHHVKQRGLVFKWPFFVKKKSYPFFDTQLKKTRPIHYAGTQKLDGLTTYKFTQRINPVRIGTEQVPGYLVGIKHEKNAVTASRIYQNYRTYWVEPSTGAPVKVSENQSQTLRAPKTRGQGLVAFKANMTTAPKDQKKLISLAKSQSLELRMLHDTGPLALLVLGLVLLAGGGVLATRRERSTQESTEPIYR